MDTDFTFFGHNCFLIEHDGEALLIDPWLNDTGAFFGSWHQWPPNGHLRDSVLQRCAAQSMSIFLSHEHQDHFDSATLSEFAAHPHCTVFIPNYKDKFLLKALTAMHLHTVELAENDLAGSHIQFRIFIDDSSINHDAAIFVRTPAFSFFNQNDCKLFDRLPILKAELGEIDYYSVQFSGANWHPACFELPEAQRRLIAKKKVLSKLKNVLGGARVLAPRFIVPAAGPAFFPFLDPALNSGNGTIFIHQEELHAYLGMNGIDNLLFPRPGDQVCADANRVPIPGPTDADIAAYRDSHHNVWEDIADAFSAERLADVLQRRLDTIGEIAMPPMTPSVAFNWGPELTDWLVVDLVGKRLLQSHEPKAPCLILKASKQYFALMCGASRWQDIVLSMQASVKRVPDVYNTVANIFLFSDESNLVEALVHNLSLSKERIVIEHQGERYEINRYCPHQGGDLAFARIEGNHLVCPRHGWRFDLDCQGACKSSGMTIEALALSKVKPVVA